ncbi:unnamed protein product (macronuclear) [Paramecium tetraurelia]|uniref:Uncharacterized protein n=1 Tax=Paramecium tetraurelia TaxID=5888 RepID=A0BDX6_PARTE|nr:uncharacterized protein GSPATT00027773001 [Paramecium tetraurelia]CAK56743.1 unnamed protein product [Paramecium tetraurelia]|eukprot:XP_001424141.1 hypothetical protein (macronuclear) [Paramecium tetraurelia strain d4-2]
MHKTYQFDSNQKPKIKDLCQEDKKKIGKLIKRLAQEREEKEILLKKLAQMQQSEQKQQRLQTEIEKLDEEISQLQDQEQLSQYQTPQLQTQSKQKLLYKFENDDENIHQSPNFKVLNQIQEDQSSSFIIPTTQRDSPIKIDQQIQTSIVQQSLQQQPIVQQKKSSKKKKEILMKKIQEFEKIVNRLNFSNEQSIELTTNRKSEEQNSQLNNTSYIQNVFQKLLNIDQQSLPTQQTVRSEQQSEIQQIQFQQQPKQYNEDDLIIQLLNSDASSYKPQNQNAFSSASNVSIQQKKQQHNRTNSTIIQNENKQNKQKIVFDQIPSPIVQDAYCRNVVEKYNSLLQELNRQQ